MTMASAWFSVAIPAGCLLLCLTFSFATDCGQVRRTFLDRGIGPGQLVPATWIKGDELQFCPSMETCCTKAMEDKYNEAVKKEFKNMLQNAGANYKTLISTSASKFRDIFIEMIEVAENSTNSLFADVYKSLDSQARVPLGQLFADMMAYMSGQSVDLEERVNSFFESMFPIAYHHSINYNQDFSELFKDCLRDRLREIRPFSDLADLITLEIGHSFETARTFLQALNLGVEVLNTTEHMEFGPECRKAFVRLLYCPHCQALVQSRPCAGLCLNVVRGCLASISELDTAWSEYVSALERMTSAMVGIYNIEHVLGSLDNRISDTIMLVTENTALISGKVKAKCGHPRRVARQVSPVTSSSVAPNPVPKQRAPDTSLYLMLQNFVNKVDESKDFFSNLADRLCSDGNLVVKGELKCWNGSAHAEYTKTVAGIGISAQKYNPEMEPPSVQDVIIKGLSDKLQHIKQELGNQVTPSPQSDSSVLLNRGRGSGSGSGSGNGSPFVDDEDYAGGASGSGDFQRESDLHFGGNIKNSPVAKAPLSSKVNILLLLLLIFANYQFQIQQF